MLSKLSTYIIVIKEEGTYRSNKLHFKIMKQYQSGSDSHNLFNIVWEIISRAEWFMISLCLAILITYFSSLLSMKTIMPITLFEV